MNRYHNERVRPLDYNMQRFRLAHMTLTHSLLHPSPHAQVVPNVWYQNFVNDMDKAMLFRVLAAANFMEISPLLDLTCLWCTFQISGKSAEEVRVVAVCLCVYVCAHDRERHTHTSKQKLAPSPSLACFLQNIFMAHAYRFDCCSTSLV
jgi:hypothetical protein